MYRVHRSVAVWQELTSGWKTDQSKKQGPSRTYRELRDGLPKLAKTD
jgi:hypothetical protein